MKIQAPNARFYLLGCFTRSSDSYHKSVSLLHLVASTFYTTKLNWGDIISKYYGRDDVIIVKVSRNIKTPYLDIDKNIFSTNLYYLFGYILNSSNVEFDANNLIDILFKNRNAEDQRLFIDRFYKLGLFIFEDITWEDLRLLYRSRRIQISGGTQNRRHLISTLQYRLVKHLIELNYNTDDIFNSKNILKNIKLEEFDQDWDSLKRSHLLNIIYTLITEDIKNMASKLDSIKKEVSKNKSSLSNVKSKIEEYELLITRLYNNMYDLDTMSYESLVSIYNNRYFNQHKSYDEKLINFIDKSPLIKSVNQIKLNNRNKLLKKNN